MDLTPPQISMILNFILLVLGGMVTQVIRVGLRSHIERLDLIIRHMEKINGRLGELEQRMASSEGREEGRK